MFTPYQIISLFIYRYDPDNRICPLSRYPVVEWNRYNVVIEHGDMGDHHEQDRPENDYDYQNGTIETRSASTSAMLNHNCCIDINQLIDFIKQSMHRNLGPCAMV